MNLPWKVSARQPQRATWTCDQLQYQRAFFMSGSIDSTSASTYSSGFQSYWAFCRRHAFDLEPTVDTLSFHIAYMAKQDNPVTKKPISARTISSYLSGIANTLEPYYPDIRKIRRHPFIIKTLRGAGKMQGLPVVRKRALEDHNIATLVRVFGTTADHDSLLFLTICLTLYHGLMRLGEIVQPDTIVHRNWRKVIRRHSVKLVSNASQDSYEFTLPAHKGDPLFHGSSIVIQRRTGLVDPKSFFERYLRSRDSICDILPNLWARADGTIPTRSWFLSILRTIFPKDVAGHSFRSGGATHLALMGVPDDKIKAIGRWSSDTFRVYIRKNPVVLMALVSRKTSLFDILSVHATP